MFPSILNVLYLLGRSGGVAFGSNLQRGELCRSQGGLDKGVTEHKRAHFFIFARSGVKILAFSG